MLKVYIWGTGKFAKKYMETGEVSEEQLLGFIQTTKDTDKFMGKTVYEPQEIVNTEYDYILICVYYVTNEIFNICKKFRIPLDKVIVANNCEWIDGTMMSKPLAVYKKINYFQDYEVMEKCFPKLYRFAKEREIAASRYIIVSRNGYDLIEENDWLQKIDFEERKYQVDYCRYRTFELYANEINKNNIEGDVAEVGVYRGVFSRLINAHFPQKNIYLFDTFNSFDEAEFSAELKAGRVPENFMDDFKSTSEDFVLSRMIYPEKCIIKKGFFPNTTVGLEGLKFAFVSIDVDFEKSVLESLRYFYPRLNCGGAIFLHDYNNRFLGGVKIAVYNYESEVGGHLKKVPIADEGGTLVIIK